MTPSRLVNVATMILRIWVSCESAVSIARGRIARHHADKARAIFLRDEGATGAGRRGGSLLARGAAAPLGAAPGPADGSHLAAAAAAAEKAIAAVGFAPRHVRARRHLEPFQDLSRSGIDAPHVALVTLPGAVPELSVDPGDPGDEAVGLDGAENRPGPRIDLMNLPLPILPDPERPFGPGE